MEKIGYLNNWFLFPQMKQVGNRLIGHRLKLCQVYFLDVNNKYLFASSI